MKQNNLRILLVDDDRTILKTYSIGLKHSGVEVFEAQTTEEAKAYAIQQVMDLAILDVILGQASGLEFASWLKDNTNIPFIFLSVCNDDEIVTKAVEYGALAYLVKPVAFNNLLPMIRASVKIGQEFNKLKNSETQLSTALAGSRNTSIAIGLIMERYSIDQKQAFDKIRNYARNKQTKLEDIASEIVQYSDAINSV